MKQYLTCGEFAKLCHTSKDTLFWYQKKGIFNPVYVDEKGYRYYDVLQYDTFLTIQQLSLAGLSLNQIKEYLDEKSPNNLISLYSDIEDDLDIKIKDLILLKNKFSNVKDSVKEGVNHEINSPFIEYRDEKKIHVSNIITEEDDEIMTREMSQLINKVSSNEIVSSHGMISYSLTNNIQFYVYGDGDNRIPAGKYVSLYHKGGFESLDMSIKLIKDYANKNNIQLDKEVYTEMVIGDWAVSNPDEYLMKIFIRFSDDN